MQKYVGFLEVGEKVLLATGEHTIEKVQYQADNVRVRLTFTDGTSIVLKEFDKVEVCLSAEQI